MLVDLRPILGFQGNYPKFMCVFACVNLAAVQFIKRLETRPLSMTGHEPGALADCQGEYCMDFY